MFDDVSVVVLAGGRGTRIQAIHPETPKPMIPVLGRPFIHWLTAVLVREGLSHFVYSTGYRGEQIEDWASDGSFAGATRLTRRETTPLGTGGGLLNCIDLCRKWALVVNGDGLCLAGLGQLLALRDRPGLDGGLIGVHAEDTSRYGSLDIDSDGTLRAFREKEPGRGYVNGGVYLFRTECLAELSRPSPVSLENNIIPGLLMDGARLVAVTVDEAPFIDIGTPETLAQAEAFIRAHCLS